MRTEYRDRMRDLGGRVLPHNRDAEDAVLSAMLSNREAIDEAMAAGLRPGHFYVDPNIRICEAIVAIAESGSPVDTQTVGAWLRGRDKLSAVGGIAYLSKLVDATPFVAHVAAHAKVVIALSRLREAIGICQVRAYEGYGPVDIDEFIDGLAQEACTLAEANSSTTGKQLWDIAKACVERAGMNGADLGGWPTGFGLVDKQTGGLFPGQLIIVAARPGQGKTSYALNIAANMAALPGAEDFEGYLVHFFSLEMPESELGHKFVCAESMVDTSAVRRRQIRPDEFGEYVGAADRVGALPIWIYDSPSVSVVEMRALVRAAQRRRPKRRHVAIVDYLQLMGGDRRERGTREEEVAGIARGLKGMAKALGIPVVALSQLNRAVETRSANDKRPTLADLRESGEIEQAADVVEFIYREEYYDAQLWNEGMAMIDVAKQRNGPTGEILLAFRKACTRFEDATAVDKDRWSRKPEGVSRPGRKSWRGEARS